jgi:hypothetical protein
MRAFAWTLVIALVCFTTTACWQSTPRKSAEGKEPRSTPGGRPDAGSVLVGDASGSREIAKADGPAVTVKVGVHPKQGGGGRNQGGTGAGLLTAGNFDDSLNPQAFLGFARRLGQISALVGLPARFQGRQVTITVRDAGGLPIDNARVNIRAGENSLTLLSRTDGRVIVVTPWDSLPNDVSWTVTVTPPDGGQAVARQCSQDADNLIVTLPDARSRETRTLDLALVVDTTGSMGDELEYLKSEMRWIAREINTRFPHVKQRYALIVYRDEGDEYVTRTFQFTPSIDQLLASIQAQSASGGGDYPEAVHKAMAQATELEWSRGRAARVLVHVADAPPHTPDLERSLREVDRIRQAGVAFYPVACSGYDQACEFHMRVSALLTGGQFLFLTDDSGIGDAHAEPTIPGYHVQRLNQLLVRMIASEIAGRRLEPESADILRTVGSLPQRR